MNAAPSTDKGRTFQHLERVLNSDAPGTVGAVDCVKRTAAAPTETYVFHSVRPYRVGGSARLAPAAHFKAEVRQARRRRRYLRGTRSSRAQIRNAAYVYNEFRKAGRSTEQALHLLRAIHTAAATVEPLDTTNGYAEATAVAPTAGTVLPVPARSHRPARFATVAAGLARIVQAFTGKAKAHPGSPHFPATSAAATARTPELFTHVDTVGRATSRAASLSIGDFRSPDVRRATHSSAVRAASGNPGGRIRFDVMETAPMEKVASPQEGARSLTSVGD